RLDEKRLQLRAALLIAPVADPDEIAFGVALQRTKHAHVRGLMPRPCARGPSALEIEIADRVAECEHAVEVAQVVLRHLLRLRHRAMMGVMKEEFVAPAARAMTADARDQLVRVPFVDEHEIGAIERGIEIE